MQVRVGERTHTIEMDIPIPIGASADMRKQLLNEAESSMEELANRIENREPLKVTRNQPTQADRAPSIKAPASSGQSAANKTTASAAPSAPTPTPLQLGATAQPPAQARGSIPPVVPVSKETAVPPTRPNIGASMPSSPGTSVDTSGSLKLPQFIQFIKDTLDLSPKQAMELLNVKSLSGLNLIPNCLRRRVDLRQPGRRFQRMSWTSLRERSKAYCRSGISRTLRVSSLMKVSGTSRLPARTEAVRVRAFGRLLMPL